MKSTLFIIALCAVATVSTAQEANSASEQKTSASSAITIPLAGGEIAAPLVLTNGVLGQPDRTELPEGGKAVFTFKVENAGDYVIKAVVKGEGEDSNSFYINVDAKPEDPQMIWDFDVTTGFEQRTVSWRGSGTPEANEIVPKKFNLTAGEHKLIIMGRETAELKSISVEPAAKP